MLSPFDFAVRLLVPTAAVFLGVCLFLTRQQLGYWHDSFRLWDHAVAVTRDNGIAHNNLGKNYQLQGRPQQALDHYREALRIDPRDVFARLNLGMLLAQLGESREAVEHLSASLRYDPRMVVAHEWMGDALLRLGQNELAAAHIAEALRLRADTDARAGRFAEAAAGMRQALDHASRAARPELVDEIEVKLRVYEGQQAPPKAEAGGPDG
jgi:tetratricopeptide (TPR) repeat protein